ncbi:MAG TPA: thermonuclease family protein [Nocardioidaceae bacterium]|nr:thermonuclease family protein [Nocardioidaceae bacterium]
MLRKSALLSLLALVGGLLVWFGQAPAAAADKDCADFDTQAQAQNFFLANDPASDPHNLDADGDWIVCESNPCPCYYGTQPPAMSGGGDKKALRQLARITRVIDGDTVKVRLLPGGPRRTVRLVGIDTPEVYGGTECGGAAASRSLKKMLPRGTKVRLVSDPSQANKDVYDRLLRYVIKAGSGRDTNRAQIWLGWATVYVYNHNPFQRTSSYRDAQAEARNGNRGIWRYC